MLEGAFYEILRDGKKVFVVNHTNHIISSVNMFKYDSIYYLFIMTMTFYLGREYDEYSAKFMRVKKFIRKLEALKTGSNAETFRWILDQMDKYVTEEEEKK